MGNIAAGAERGQVRGIPEKEEIEEAKWAFLVPSPMLALETVPWGIISGLLFASSETDIHCLRQRRHVLEGC